MPILKSSNKGNTMKLHKDIQRAIDAYALSTIPVLPSPEPIKWEGNIDSESKAAMNLQDTKNCITKRDREALHAKKKEPGYVGWFLSL